MKLILGDAVIAIAHIAYAQQVSDDVVEIYFVGLNEPLKVYCGEDQVMAEVYYSGSADNLLDTIYKEIGKSDITFSSEI